MKTNTKATTTHFTHEGAPTHPLKPIEALRRSVMAHMLWEGAFYEDGVSAADRVKDLCQKVSAHDLAKLTVEVHKKGLLRHMPLFMIIQLLAHKDKSSVPLPEIIESVCTRPDQMTELLSLYWTGGRKPLASGLKKGLAKAFVKFDEHRLAKWNRDSTVKLKDVLFMCHPKPKDDAQAELWKRLIAGTMATPDTWETRLSAGADKKESFQELLQAGKLGLLAMLMNMRNMQESGVPKALVKEGLLKKTMPMLPFKFLAATKACPPWEDIIDEAMIASAAKRPKLPGKTFVFVDVSGSMDAAVSGKSTIMRTEAAAAFAILLRECCEEIEILSFSNYLCGIAPRHGSALKDAIITSQQHSGTDLRAALSTFAHHIPGPYHRLIVVTDEQVSKALLPIKANHKYILNVAACQNGIGAQDGWLTISGFSEASIDYIMEVEGSVAQAPTEEASECGLEP